MQHLLHLRVRPHCLEVLEVLLPSIVTVLHHLVAAFQRSNLAIPVATTQWGRGVGPKYIFTVYPEMSDGQGHVGVIGGTLCGGGPDVMPAAFPCCLLIKGVSGSFSCAPDWSTDAIDDGIEFESKQRLDGAALAATDCPVYTLAIGGFFQPN